MQRYEFSTSGFGFVRFGEQNEQVIALQTMQGRVGLGEKPIKVSVAFAKGKVLIMIIIVISSINLLADGRE